MKGLYSTIPIWENKRRIRILEEFGEAVALLETDPHQFQKLSQKLSPHEDYETARGNAVGAINHLCSAVEKIVEDAGNPHRFVNSMPAPIIGGPVVTLDVILNVLDWFRAQNVRLACCTCIGRTIGVYQMDTRKAWIRTVNPFFWIGRLPIFLLKQFGVDKKRAEEVWYGRVLKLVFGAASVLSAARFLWPHIGE